MIQKFKINSILFETNSVTQKGEAPTEEEQDRFDEVYMEGVECVDSREDMWTDAKGGYEVSYELIEEPNE